MSRLVILPLLALALALPVQSEPLGAAKALPTLDQQAEQLKPYKQLLQGALQNGLNGGTLAAMAACQLMAPALQSNLTSAVIEVGRASHKPRNPANGLQPWMLEAHRDYLQGGDSAPRQIELNDGSVGYLEPIYLQQGCLQCHGAVLTGEVSDFLAANYAADRATGFAVGDYRGLFWLKTIAVKTPQQ